MFPQDEVSSLLRDLAGISSDRTPVPTPDSGPGPSFTGLERVFQILTAAQIGGPLVRETLDQVLAETAAEPVGRGELLGGLLHVCLVAVGALAELTDQSEQLVITNLRGLLAGDGAAGAESSGR